MSPAVRRAREMAKCSTDPIWAAHIIQRAYREDARQGNIFRGLVWVIGIELALAAVIVVILVRM